jgi:histone-lysine N-methyltransferase SUV420H
VDSSTRRVTHKALPALDRKLAAAASASASVKPRKREDVNNERPAKRRKTEPGPRLEVMSAKARKALAEAPRKKRHSLPKPAPSTGEKRRRGRPRLRSPTKEIKVEDSVSQVEDDTKPQPRNHNGRFEKKFRSASGRNVQGSPRTVLSRAERAIERGKAKEREEDAEERNGSSTWTSPRRKRLLENDAQLEELPTKRAYRRRDENLQPLKRVLPRPASSFKGGKLFSNPNPLSYALQAWAGPMILDESSSEDDKPPVTPEDPQSPPATVIEDESNINLTLSSLLIPAAALPRGALTFKPSPFNFAKRRWMSVSTSSCNENRGLDAEKRGGQRSPRKDKTSISSGIERRSISETHPKADQHHGISSARSGRAGPPYTTWSEASPDCSSDEEVRPHDCQAAYT